MARLVSLTILTTLIVVLGITFFRVIAPFLLPLFLAGVVTILCQPLFRYFKWRTKQRVRISAGLTTACVLSIVFVPLLSGIFIGSMQLYSLISSGRLNRAFSGLRVEVEDGVFERIQPFLPKEETIDPKDETIDEQGHQATNERDALNESRQTARQREAFNKRLTELQENARSHLQTLAERSLGLAGKKTFDILGGIAAGLISLIIFAIALYYFLADGPALVSASEGLIPVHVDYQRKLLEEFEKVVRAVVMATFLAAIAQGLATSVGLYVVGFRHFFIIFVVSTLASVIPLAGTWLIWGPCAIWLAIQGDWVSAILLTLFGFIVIGMIDNVIRAYVLSSDAKLHPLLAFVSVLGGLQVMGLWGVFTGPIVACCLHALIKIFNTELTEFSKERFAIGGDENQDDAPLEQPAPESKRLEQSSLEAEPDGKEPVAERPPTSVGETAETETATESNAGDAGSE